MATRGRPEQILPSQFAIDDIEFLRRFAENELLYFHREEPHAPVTEELVLLIDQGVRTWGRVRHALVASALAFGKLAGSSEAPSARWPGQAHKGGCSTRLQTDERGRGRPLGVERPLRPTRAWRWSGSWKTSAAGRRDVVVLSHPSERRGA